MRFECRLWAHISLAVLLLVLSVPVHVSTAPRVTLWPEITVDSSALYDHFVSTTAPTDEGSPLTGLFLRLGNTTVNVGTGRLTLRAPNLPNPDSTQDVWQLVHRDDGTSWSTYAGQFIFHPGHGHIHFEEWSEYRLRQVLPGGGIGPVIASSEKISFCIIDGFIYDSGLPGFSPDPAYADCGWHTQGLSVGWADGYGSFLPDQHIDIRGVRPDQYWLESKVDPANRVMEVDETNNTSRILITTDTTDGLDAYEPNEVLDDISREAIVPGSPNLGPCNPERLIAPVTLEPGDAADVYRFYIASTGTESDFVRADVIPAAPSVNVVLLDADGQPADSVGGTGFDQMRSLSGFPSGWYFARVTSLLINSPVTYALTINPPEGSPPTIVVEAPTSGQHVLMEDADSTTVAWQATPGTGGSSWVTIYLNSAPILDGQEFVPYHTHNLNAVGEITMFAGDFPVGEYFVYCEANNGGGKAGAWAAGSIVFTEAPDADKDGVHDALDNCADLHNPPQEDGDGDGIGDACETEQPVFTAPIISAFPGDTIVWELNLDNPVNISEITIPLDYSGAMSAMVIDSISTVGCRTAYFERQHMPIDRRDIGRLVFRLVADNDGGVPPLMAGTGPVARICFRVPTTAPTDSFFTMSFGEVIGPYVFQVDGTTISYDVSPPQIGINVQCKCPCIGDPDCDGFGMDIGDVVRTIDVALRGHPSAITATCEFEHTDLNCDFVTDLLDVIYSIDVAFRNGHLSGLCVIPCQ